MDSPPGMERPGLIKGVSSIARNAFGLIVSRIELAALEFGEIRNNLAKVLFVGALGLLLVWFALACWTALIVVLAWESWGWKILLLMAAIFTFVAIGVFLYVRALFASDKLSMPATMAELRKDRDALL
jgi:uncharacterized membrane protein YqjE